MKTFDGVFTALITPFKDDKLDIPSFERLVRFQLKGGVKKFVINGTTGESPTLEWNEVETLFKTAKEIAPKESVFLLGTGSNSTKKAIEATKKAKTLGADGALIVCPYYNKPTQAGLLAHYSKIAQEVDLPQVIYDVPGRTITEISKEVTIKLSEQKNIVGIKDATGNLEKGADLIAKTKKDFIVTSGDDASAVKLALRGGRGIISVMSHILPSKTVYWMQEAMMGNAQVQQDFEPYLDLINKLYIEANPIPVKKALQLMGIIDSAELRLPLTELGPQNTEVLKQALKKMQLI